MRHFLSLDTLSKDEILKLNQHALDLKKSPRSQVLSGKTLAMIFEKPSNRTRLSFETGMFQLGGHAIRISDDEIGVGTREAVKDIARVMSRYVDCIMYRCKRHEDIAELARYASVPVINGLSDFEHPCQAMADLLTISENFPTLSGLKVVYVGDWNNVSRSLLKVCQKVDIEFCISGPKSYMALDEIRDVYEEDPFQAVKNADVIYTDVWTSMGQEEERIQRLSDFKSYSVTENLMAAAKSNAIFLHCLPAHRDEEVTDGVMEASFSKVFDQAENRMHAQKAVLLSLLTPDFN